MVNGEFLTKGRNATARKRVYNIEINTLPSGRVSAL